MMVSQGRFSSPVAPQLQLAQARATRTMENPKGEVPGLLVQIYCIPRWVLLRSHLHIKGCGKESH